MHSLTSLHTDFEEGAGKCSVEPGFTARGHTLHHLVPVADSVADSIARLSTG